MKQFFLIFLLISAISLYSCNNSMLVENDDIVLLQKIRLKIEEPSGLSLGSNNTLWTVSDRTNNIYNISLDGKILKEIPFNGNDLEGVFFNKNDYSLWIVQEANREIIKLDTTGNILFRKKLNLPQTQINSGLEGICGNANSIFLINEKKTKLWIKLTSKFFIEESERLRFSKDISGITYDEKRKEFWIVSDQSQLLFRWTKRKGLTKSYKLFIRKPEGIAIDTANDQLYIVSDKTNELFIYKITK